MSYVLKYELPSQKQHCGEAQQVGSPSYFAGRDSKLYMILGLAFLESKQINGLRGVFIRS